MSHIIEFYSGEKTGAGRTFEHILTMDDIALESGHDWVQWLFPLPEPSKAQPSSPVMTEADIEMFKTDPEIRANAERAYTRWFAFLENTTQWLRPRDHNHLRITRAIRFLTLIDMSKSAENLHEYACGQMMEHVGDYFPKTTEGYWTEALKEDPSWLQ